MNKPDNYLVLYYNSLSYADISSEKSGLDSEYNSKVLKNHDLDYPQLYM